MIEYQGVNEIIKSQYQNKKNKYKVINEDIREINHLQRRTQMIREKIRVKPKDNHRNKK